MILVAVIALGLVAILPRFSERLRSFERYVFVKLHEGDLYRHADVVAIRRLADDFARAVRSGQPDAALGLASAAFRKRTTADRLRTLGAEVGLDQGPYELVEATCSLPEGGDRFVSEYALRCGPPAGPNRAVKLVVITEGGWLRVDRVEAGSK